MSRFIVCLAICVAVAFANVNVPGADFLCSGFDGLKLEGGLSPIFEWSYSKGKTFSPLASKGAITYNVPNFVSAFDMEKSGEVVSETIYQHFESYFKEVVAGFDLSVTASLTKQMSGAISANVEWGKIHTQMNSENKQMAYNNHWWTFFKLTSLPAIILKKDDTFEAMVSVLPYPVTSFDDQDVYNQMVLAFGTHYYARLHMGAYVHFDTFIDQKIAQSKDQSWLKAQAALTFHYKMWDIAFKPTYSKSSIHIDNTFSMNANSHSFFHGGNPQYQSNTTLKEWEASLVTNPAVVNVTVQPIWMVMHATPARDHLKATVEYYLKEGKVPTAVITNYRTNVVGPYDHLLSMSSEDLARFDMDSEDIFVETEHDREVQM